jgi:hypothetical protein
LICRALLSVLTAKIAPRQSQFLHCTIRLIEISVVCLGSVVVPRIWDFLSVRSAPVDSQSRLCTVHRDAAEHGPQHLGIFQFLGRNDQNVAIKQH